MTAPAVDKPDTEDDAQPEHTGGMVALIPANTDDLAVEGGDPSEQLHLTLAFLGEDVTDWPEGTRAALAQAVTDLAEQVPLIQARVFGHATFNPDGYADRDPCAVYLVGDGKTIADLRGAVLDVVRRQVDIPDQHEPFTPHITAGFGVDASTLSFTGPVTFDRLRVALADEVTDLPLGEEGTVTAPTDTEEDEGLTAAVSAKQREKAEEEGDTYPGTDQYPIDTRDRAKSAVRLYGNSDLPAEKVKAWLKRRLKAKGWDDLIPDAWKSDSVKASAELDDTQRQAITAAALAMVKDLGPTAAYASAPLVFHDPARLAVADEAIELPDDDALVASAGDELPPAEWFEQPSEPFELGIHVDDKRVWGWLAEWQIPHIGASGQTIYAPRSKSNYRWFHTKSARVQGPDGPERLNIGHITFGTGHAPTDQGTSHLAAAAHYDHSGVRGAKVRVGEDEHGIWFAGALCAGIDGARLEEFEESDTSGDWRRIMGGLELVACLGVNVGGFPKIGLSLAASGEPLALVASAKAWGNPAAAVDVDAIAEAVVSRWEQRQDERALTAALATERDALLDDLDDSEDRLAEVLVDLYFDDLPDDTVDAVTADAVPSRMPPQLQKSYLVGKVAKRIRWRTPGDMTRCMAQAKVHGMGHKAAGACAVLHHKATGMWPGDKNNR